MKFIKTKTESTPAAVVPTKREVNPTYGALIDRASTLRAEQNLLRREGAAIQARLLAEGGQDGRQARAVQILDGTSSTDTVADKDRLAAIIQKVGDLDAALAIIAKRIAVESNKASDLIIDKVESRYRKSVATLCKRLTELHLANLEFHTLTDSLNVDDVNWTGRLRPMHPIFLENPRAKFGPVGAFLHDAVAHGFFDADDVPLELQL